MFKLSLVATGLSFPTFALANSLQHIQNIGGLVAITLLAFFATAALTQIGFYLRYSLKQSREH